VKVGDKIQRTYGESPLKGELLDVVKTYAGNFWTVRWIRSEKDLAFLESVGVEYDPKKNIDIVSEEYLRLA
tara:strand:- start:361 stop:573 length:213 start_codon:yes stop_codon:yes gene_type:complete